MFFFSSCLVTVQFLGNQWRTANLILGNEFGRTKCHATLILVTQRRWPHVLCSIVSNVFLLNLQVGNIIYPVKSTLIVYLLRVRTFFCSTFYRFFQTFSRSGAMLFYVTNPHPVQLFSSKTWFKIVLPVYFAYQDLSCIETTVKLISVL